jgi:hypothetical protein
LIELKVEPGEFPQYGHPARGCPQSGVGGAAGGRCGPRRVRSNARGRDQQDSGCGRAETLGTSDIQKLVHYYGLLLHSAGTKVDSTAAVPFYVAIDGLLRAGRATEMLRASMASEKLWVKGGPEKHEPWKSR